VLGHPLAHVLRELRSHRLQDQGVEAHIRKYRCLLLQAFGKALEVKTESLHVVSEAFSLCWLRKSCGECPCRRLRLERIPVHAFPPNGNFSRPRESVLIRPHPKRLCPLHQDESDQFSDLDLD
jgi:hypothetical protein